MFRKHLFSTFRRRAVQATCRMLLVAGAVAAGSAQAQANDKYAAIVTDMTTGRVLHEQNADARRYPASLTKMMTLYILFEELDRGRYSLSSPLKGSAHSASMPPSKLGLRPGETIPVEAAIKALVTRSANDVAAAIGENISGSERAFADRMTRTARALGMRGTQFRNASGLPDLQQYTTARDMMRLGVALQVRFPQYYGYFSTRSFVWKGQTIGNHNRLLGSVDGVDGIKTGYVRMSGFNLVTSMKRDGRKVVAVVLGGTSGASRDNQMRSLLATYFPKASRGRGVDDSLVASAVGRKVPVAASNVAIPVGAAAQRQIAALAGHPMPPPRPVMPTQEIVTASIMPTATVEVARVPIAPIPPRTEVSYVNTPLPASASEAFADVEDEGIAMGDASDDEGPITVATLRVPVPAANVATAAAPSGSWVIQIGALPSENAALALIEKARSTAGRALAAANPVTEVFSKGSSTYVRARFAGFQSADDANRACAALKARDFACYAVRS